MNKADDWLLYLACNAIKRDRFLKRIYRLSGVFFATILFFSVSWPLFGFWRVQDGLTYAGIYFILFAAFVHLSDRVFLSEEHVKAIIRPNEGNNLGHSIQILRRKRLGIVSCVFLALGFLGEAGAAYIAILNH
jgi:hypothetical protein